MLRYIVRRILLTIPVLFGILTLVFFLGHVLPGDACRALLGERATDAVCAAYTPAALARRPGAVRSPHPTHSVAGMGPLAEACVLGHGEPDSPTGSTSPCPSSSGTTWQPFPAATSERRRRARRAFWTS